MEKLKLYRSVAVLMSINVTDSIIDAVVGPSLIFYILELGGTKDDYGLLSSAVCIAGFIMTGVYGGMVDTNGNRYRGPYTLTFALGVAGSLIYFLAVVFPRGRWAIGAIFVGRFVSGMGSAGKTLSYSWIATVVPKEKQRTLLSVMSMTRTLGTAIGPMLNILVAEVNTTIGGIAVNPLNAPGLLLAAGEVFLFSLMYLFLDEPPSATDAKSGGAAAKKAGLWEIWEAVSHFELWFRLANVFVMVVNFTCIGTGMALVAFELFDWGPVQVSWVSSINSITMLVGMNVSLVLSMTSISDTAMMVGGHLLFAVGGGMAYAFWTTGAKPWQFVVPIVVLCLGYPPISPANRSKFTKAVHARPELQNSHGVMQGLLVQAFTVAGIVAPPLVTAFVLKDPDEFAEEAATGKRLHALTPWALVGTSASVLSIVGLIYEHFAYPEQKAAPADESAAEQAPATESTGLVGGKKSVDRRKSSMEEIAQNLSTRFERDRRLSVEVPGMPACAGTPNFVETKDEVEYRESLLEDWKAWEELARIDARMEEEEEAAGGR